MDVSTQVLRIFCRVAELGSFTRAAEELYFTQPHVSAQLAKLEQSVGLTLFDHLGKRVYLTAGGELFYRQAREILRLAEETDRAMAELRGDGVGHLRIGASTTIGTYILPVALTRFRCLRERLKVSLEIGNTAQIADGVVQNRLDFGFVAGPIERSELETRPVLADELVLIVGLEHPWAGLTQVGPADLTGQPFISRERGSTMRLVAERELAKHGVRPAIVMEMNSTEAIKLAVARGAGISIVSEFAVAEPLLSAPLHVLPIAGLDLHRDLVLFFHKDKHRTPSMNAFLAFVEDYFAAGTPTTHPSPAAQMR